MGGRNDGIRVGVYFVPFQIGTSFCYILRVHAECCGVSLSEQHRADLLHSAVTN